MHTSTAKAGAPITFAMEVKVAAFNGHSSYELTVREKLTGANTGLTPLPPIFMKRPTLPALSNTVLGASPSAGESIVTVHCPEYAL